MPNLFIIQIRFLKNFDKFKTLIGQELLPVAVNAEESNKVEEERDPVEADNFGRAHDSQNNCSNRTKTDEHAVVDAEYFDKPGSLVGETMQEKGDEDNLEESSNQANTEDQADDEYVENIHATETHINLLQEVFRIGAAVVGLPRVGVGGECRGAYVELWEVPDGG